MTDNINVNVTSPRLVVRNYQPDINNTNNSFPLYANLGNSHILTNENKIILRECNTPRKVHFSGVQICDSPNRFMVNENTNIRLGVRDLRHKINQRKYTDMDDYNAFEIKREPEEEVSIPPVPQLVSCLRKPAQNLAERRMFNLRRTLMEENVEHKNNYHIKKETLPSNNMFFENKYETQDPQNDFNQNIPSNLRNNNSGFKITLQNDKIPPTINNFGYGYNPENSLKEISPSATSVFLTERFSRNQREFHKNSTFTRGVSYNDVSSSAMTFNTSNNDSRLTYNNSATPERLFPNPTIASIKKTDNDLLPPRQSLQTIAPERHFENKPRDIIRKVNNDLIPPRPLLQTVQFRFNEHMGNNHSTNLESYRNRFNNTTNHFNRDEPAENFVLHEGLQNPQEESSNSYNYSNTNSVPNKNIHNSKAFIDKEVTPKKVIKMTNVSNYTHAARMTTANDVDDYNSEFRGMEKNVRQNTPHKSLSTKISASLPNSPININTTPELKQNIAPKAYSANDRLKKLQANLKLNNSVAVKDSTSPKDNKPELIRRWDKSVSNSNYQTSNLLPEKKYKNAPNTKIMANNGNTVNFGQNDEGKVKNLASDRMQRLLKSRDLLKKNNNPLINNKVNKTPQKKVETPDSNNYEYEEMDWEDIPEEVIINKINDLRGEIGNKPIGNPSIDVTPFASGQKDEWYIVIDTNVFLSNLSFVKKLLDVDFEFGKPTILIPWMVLQELDYIKDSRNSSDGQRLSMIARSAISFLNNMIEKGSPRIRGQSAKDADLQKFQSQCADDKILNCCLFMKEKIKHVILLSNDINLRNKAIMNDIKAFSKESLITSVKAMFENIRKKQSKTQNTSEKKISVPKNIRIKRKINDDIPMVKEKALRVSPPSTTVASKSIMGNNSNPGGSHMSCENLEEVNRSTVVEDILGVILKFCQLFCQHIFLKLSPNPENNAQDNAKDLEEGINLLRKIPDLKSLVQNIQSLFESIMNSNNSVAIDTNLINHLTMLLGRFMTKYQDENTQISAPELLHFLQRNWDKLGVLVQQLEAYVNTMSYAESRYPQSNFE